MASIKVEKFIQAVPSEVYRYFTNSTALRDWMCNVATVQPHPGGRIYLCWPGEYYTSGEYIQLEKDKLVSFSWFGRGEPRSTKVEIVLKKQKGGTLVKLTHRGIGKGKKWEGIGKTYAEEWRNSLENLTSVLETGADLRITRRPMLGIYVGEFNPEIAKRICVPVEYGVRLEGVLDGMGAKDAGLKKNDVIIALDGQELKPPVQFEIVMRGKHAGDVLEVSYYRGSEKNTVKMTLSGRSIPSIPASPSELARQIEPIYRKYEAEIEALINSASEEECAHKPTPEEWSVDEVLAHLIHGEIGWQNFYTEIVFGHEAAYDDYGGNLQARIDGTTAVFKTKADLLKELKQHDAETLAGIAHLPEDFASHKGQFWKLTFQASQNSNHFEDHLGQMRAAVASARKQ